MKNSTFTKFDLMWQKYQEKLQSAMKENDWYSISLIYKQMSDFLLKEGKDNKGVFEQYLSARKKVAQKSLMEYKNSGVVKGIEVLGASDSCELCKAVNGKKSNLEAELAKSTIPVTGCSHKYGCRCTYIPVIDS